MTSDPRSSHDMTRQFDAVIFDLDGTLVDTEPLHRRSWEIALAELGRPMPDGEYALHFSGRPGREICRDRLRMSATETAATVELVTRRYWELAAGNLSPLPGLPAFLERIRGVPTAIATSAHRSSALRVLAEIGLADTFDAVVTVDEVTHGKPHPEIFLTAAAKLGVTPARCLAFEDAAAGLASARAAGMTCVGITTTRRLLEDAHHLIDGYEDARLDALLGALGV
jgi:HAD superfamily hydrolase (TIGR01509 family)